jgi:hypothetical protein
MKPVGEPDAVAPHVRFVSGDGKRGVGHEKSDGATVPEKRSNNEGLASAETVEGRAPPKGKRQPDSPLDEVALAVGGFWRPDVLHQLAQGSLTR